MKPDINAIWKRIQQHVGEVFHTKRGKPLTYKIDGEYMRVSRDTFPRQKDWFVPRSKFAKALPNVPCDGPSTLQLHGGSYIWAVLHDRRIRRSDY